MKNNIYLLVFFLFMVKGSVSQDSNLYYTSSGVVSFRSEAQQEIIRASSSRLIGIIDPKNRSFIFKVLVRTFHGFNSALQQEHFNEKYMESEEFPEAAFNGKIIEDMDLSIPGIYEVRAKGKLTVHGIEKERIIRCKAEVTGETIKVISEFSVVLSDHNIKVPRVVHEKIAREIAVSVSFVMTKKK